MIEEENNAVQYSFALDENKIITHITKAKDSFSFYCCGCGQEVIAVKGEINAHHFRHKNVTCSYESYLHQTAKKAFYDVFNRHKQKTTPLPIHLHRSVECKSKKLNESVFEHCSSSEPVKYDLTSLFDSAELEAYDRTTGLRPDVLLSNSTNGHKCYIEIFVSHKSSQEKVNTNMPIIEFNITSDEDIRYILNGIYYECEKLEFINFSPKTRILEECDKNCNLQGESFYKWWLGDNGRMRQTVSTFSDLTEDDLKSENCWPVNIYSGEEYDLLVRFVRSADSQNAFYNCLKCSYSEGWHDGDVTCSIKGVVNYTAAQECLHYTGNHE